MDNLIGLIVVCVVAAALMGLVGYWMLRKTGFGPDRDA